MFAEVRRRLAVWLWPDINGTAVMPGDSCAHNHDPELMMRRLLRAAPRDPLLLAQTLAEFAGCGGCLTAALVHTIYTLTGIVTDYDPKDAATQPPACACVTSPEAIATAVTLALDAGDGDQLCVALQPIVNCHACLLSTIVAIATQNVHVLDGLETTLRPALDAELQTIFGGER